MNSGFSYWFCLWLAGVQLSQHAELNLTWQYGANSAMHDEGVLITSAVLPLAGNVHVETCRRTICPENTKFSL